MKLKKSGGSAGIDKKEYKESIQKTSGLRFG